jgi:glyoxylase-like metal-dependent hydrolase (beta-lactamase superfamily II)
VRAVSLHRDVLLVTSALLQVNCVIVRGPVRDGEGEGGSAENPVRVIEPGGPVAAAEGGPAAAAAETFVIDSPVLPDELDALGTLLRQAGFPEPSGLLATHGDWDHLLGRLAFPGVALGCAESTAERLRAVPGEAQRELRAFDEQLMIERPRPLSLGSVQPLPVPGRCELGEVELELHQADGHTLDGMAVVIPWAGVLVAGDYLSTVEIPTLNAGDTVDEYLATLERLRPLLANCEHVVPGHGPVIDTARALSVLEEDVDYLRQLRALGAETELPASRGGAAQRRLHRVNVSAL